MRTRCSAMRHPHGLYLAAAAFVAASAGAAWRLHRLRYANVWIDESQNVAIGWLISEGHRLYETQFAHHLLLAYMGAHAVAVLSPSDDLAHFRLVPLLAHLAAGLCFVGSPLAARTADRGWLAGGLFVAACALLSPLWWGTRLLTDVLWGCALVASSVNLWLPLCFGIAPSRARAALGGATLAVWVSGSLITLYPLLVQGAVLGVALVASSRHRDAARRAFAPTVLGVIAVAAFEFVWLLRYGDLAGFVDQAIRFNFVFYAPAQGFSGSAAGPVDVVMTGLAGAAHGFIRDFLTLQLGEPATWFAPLAVVACLGLGIPMARSFAAPSNRIGYATVILTVLAQVLLAATLRVRGDGSHVAPYHLWLVGAGAAATCFLPDRRRVAVALGVVALGAVLAASAWTALRLDRNEPDLRRSLPRALATFAYVRAHTRPDERFLALNVEPLAYVLARRHPAHAGVFYLPWQAAWERSRAMPDSCAQVRANPPRFVYFAPIPVHGHAWSSYGTCFDTILQELYEPVLALETKSLWQLRGAAAPDAYTPGSSSGQFDATVPPSTSKTLPVTQAPAGEQR